MALKSRIVEAVIIGTFILDITLVWLMTGWYFPKLHHAYFSWWMISSTFPYTYRLQTVAAWANSPAMYHSSFPSWYMHYLPYSIGVVLFCVLTLAYLWRGEQEATGHVRGLRLLTPVQLQLQLHGVKRRVQSGINIGEVTLPQRLENEHFLVTGSPGAGKSTLIRHLLYQLQAREQVVIINDPDGEFVQEFYDEARGDLVLNPLDKRCPKWTPWSEFRYGSFAMDAEALAASLVRGGDPAYTSGADRFFLMSSRALIMAMFQQVKHRDNTDALLDFIAQPTDQLRRTLAGTRAASLIHPDAHGQSAGILGTVSNAISGFRYLPLEGKQWSAREWAIKPQGWIFLSSTEDVRDAIQNLQGLWLDCLVRWLMSNELGSQQVWIMADEMPALGYQPQIEKLVTRGRKRSLAVVMGFQNVSQLRSLYGKDGSVTLTSSPTTKIILRCDESETAKWASDLLGARELDRISTTQVKSVNNGRDGVNLSTHRVSERLVTPSEVQLLPPLQGYMCIAGHDRSRIEILPRYLQSRVPAFVARH